MEKLLDLLSRFFRPRHADWRFDAIRVQMRRWNGKAWEYRLPTPDELHDAEYWQAIR